MNLWTNTSVSVLLLFTSKGIEEKFNPQNSSTNDSSSQSSESDLSTKFCQPWLLADMNLVKESEQIEAGVEYYEGRIGQQRYELAWTLAHDDIYMFRLRLFLEQTEEQTDSNPLRWKVLRNDIDKKWEDVIKNSYPSPFSITYLYHHVVPGYSVRSDMLEYAKKSLTDMNEAAIYKQARSIAGGVAWQLAEKPIHTSRTRKLVILTKKTSELEYVSKELLKRLDSGSYGWGRVELYLYNAQRYISRYHKIATKLTGAVQGLESSIRQLGINDPDTSGKSKADLAIYEKALKNTENKLTSLIYYKLKADTFFYGARDASLNTVELKLNSIGLDKAKESDVEGDTGLTKLYADDLQILKHQIKQIEFDLKYAETVRQGAQPIRELWRQRQSERLEETSFRLEQANFLLGIAVSVLAGVSIFNSVLDIWNLALVGTSFETIQPHPLIRMLWGGIASVGVLFLLRSMLNNEQAGVLRGEVKRMDLFNVSKILFGTVLFGTFLATLLAASAIEYSLPISLPASTLFSLVLAMLAIGFSLYLVKKQKRESEQSSDSDV
ncbi:hypothetical protein QUF64_07040 [Anaerolineales bacterium HSG6]|nr:hypothetical protein [Anaerolineales bacterium HSG6]